VAGNRSDGWAVFSGTSGTVDRVRGGGHPARAPEAMMSFGGSEKLRLLRERYRASAGQIVDGFRSIAVQLAGAPIDDTVLDGLRRELHRVHGTAGSYGYAAVSDLAAALEERVAGWMSDPTLEAGERAALVTEFAQRIDTAFNS
jgi:chemotaxis protein histidine kinase CheA